MANNGEKEAKNTSTHTMGHSQDRAKRRTYAITQRGVKTSPDLSALHSAMLADIDSGVADLREINLMKGITGQIIAHENAKIRLGMYKAAAKKIGGFFPTD